MARIARIAATLAGAGLVLSPVAATAAPTAKPHRTVPITIPLSYAPSDAAVWSIDAETAHKHRWRRDRHRDRVDGGDVLGGLLVIGGIAAIAAAIGKDKQERRADRDYPYRDAPGDYGDEPEAAPDYGRAEPGSAEETDRAVQACSAEAARGGKVDEIFDVEKVDGEWRVRGDYTSGRQFDCTVDANGRAYVGNGEGH